MRIVPMRRRAHKHARLPTVVLAAVLLVSCVSSRVLHQSSGNTADQLVSDGSDSPPAQSASSSESAASPKPSTAAAVASPDAGVPPSQQVRLRWANQVEALPPAYQAAGAGVLNDILGPSGDQSSGAGVQDMSSGEQQQPWYTASPAVAPSPSDAAATESMPAASPAEYQWAEASSPPPQETPVPTAVPVATPQPAAGPLVPLLGGESAAAPVLAPGQAPALTPEAAPAPSPEPTLNAACAENGTNNAMGLSVCRFMTAFLSQQSRTRTCGRYLPRCAPSPGEAPTQSMASAAEPVAVPAPAPATRSDNTTDVGMLLQPILAGVEGILGGQPAGNSTTSSGGIAGLFG